MSKYKIGDKFRSLAAPDEPELEVIYVTPGGRCVVVKDGFEHFLSEDFLDIRFKKVEPFYEVGKVYRFPGSIVTYKVIELHNLDGKPWALAIRSAKGEERSLNMLGPRAFEDMEEVDPNR